jgi:hypothetical protein
MADESFEILDEESFFEGGPKRTREERRRARAAANAKAEASGAEPDGGLATPKEAAPPSESGSPPADGDVLLLIGDELSDSLDESPAGEGDFADETGTSRREPAEQARESQPEPKTAAPPAPEKPSAPRTAVQEASDRLRQILDETGVFSDVDLLGVQQSAPHEFLGDVLIDRGMLRECDIHGMLTRALHIPFIRADQLAVDEEITRLVGEEFCRDHDVMPIAKARRFLTVATSNPLNQRALDLLSQLTELTIRVVLCSFHDLHTLIERAYHPEDESSPEDAEADEMSSLVSTAAELLATSSEGAGGPGGQGEMEVAAPVAAGGNTQ